MSQDMNQGLTPAEEFIRYAIFDEGALEFPSGGHKLKSDRLSPYFFNAGQFNNGGAQEVLSFAYANVIAQHFERRYFFPFEKHNLLEFNLLYGPPYKGIMLATAIAMQLSRMGFEDTYFCSSRKETKEHGEGGVLFGAPIDSGSRVVIVDDVITDGGTKAEAVEFIRSYGGQVTGLVIAFDRQERGTGTESAAQEFTRKYGVPVYSIATLTDLISFMRKKAIQSGPYKKGDDEVFKEIIAYQKEYGVS